MLTSGIGVGVASINGVSVGLAVGLGDGVSSTAKDGAARLIANAQAAAATEKDLEKIAIYLKIDAHTSTARLPRRQSARETSNQAQT